MRRTRKSPGLLGCLIMVACAALQAGCSSAITRISPAAPSATSTALIAGVGTDAPGWSSLAVGSDTRSGFDIDLVRWLAQRHHVLPSFVDITSSERMPALRNHQVRIVVDTFSITDDRRKEISFAGPYIITRQGFLVRTGSNQVRSLGDLAGKIVCTARGTTSLLQLQQLNKGPLDGRMTITQEDSDKECVNDLNARTVDAVSTDQLILAGFAGADPGHGLMVIPSVTFGEQERYGIGLPLGDTVDCRIYSADLRDFIVSGQWAEFFQQEFPGIPAAGHEPTPEYLDPC
jgi:glutamate transport system substrate-binding protein